MYDEPIVTVITPVFNGKRFLKPFFAMLVEQSVPLKLIIIDDVSSDNSMEIVNGMISDVGFETTILQNKEKAGPGGSRAKGLKYVTTDYVAFCDVDDVWPPDKLEVQVERMLQLDSKWSFHGRKLVLEDNRKIGVVNAVPIESIYTLLGWRHIGLSSVMLSSGIVKDLPDVSGLFACEDYIWWAHIFMNHGPPLVIDNIFYNYHVSAESLSSNKVKMAQAVFRLYVWEGRLPVTRVNGMLLFLVYAIVSAKNTLRRLRMFGG